MSERCQFRKTRCSSIASSARDLFFSGTRDCAGNLALMPEVFP